MASCETRLSVLFAYTEEPHPFTPAEVAALLAAIDELKILDPACGSGVFPMGVLHKLVYLLSKLDPDNVEWEKLQIAKVQEITDTEERRRKLAEIASNFADNNDDYGRKLYLIENCLYGVDIQPIAIQITKLRFFISLVCDQKTNRNKKEAMRSMEVFSGQRILIQVVRNPSLRDRIVAAYSDQTFITRINVFSLLPRTDPKIDLFVLLAILNSRFMNWFLKLDYGLHTWVITGVLSLPIKAAALDGKAAVALRGLSQSVITAKQATPVADTSAMEREIDQQVYALYGLTAEEIALVEGGEK